MLLACAPKRLRQCQPTPPVLPLTHTGCTLEHAIVSAHSRIATADRTPLPPHRCSQYTCGTTAHCGGCTAANQICEANRPCTSAFDNQCSGTTGATIMGAHRMCNEKSDCAPLCSCDTVAAAVAAAPAATGSLLSSAPTSSSSAPVAAPTGTCD
eukprot:scaffold52131_cov57-Phaeocystis_antarctica.AAC.1